MAASNTLPQQAPVPQNRLMRAPYNFVPLPAAVYSVTAEPIPPHDHYDSTKHTGFIELEIETETLLYTRCAYRPALADTKVYLTPERQEFFHHGNPTQPFIPGSSLRGMLRTLVEIIGFGKMNAVFDEKLIYRAVAESTSLDKAYRERMLGSGNPLPYPSANLKGGYLHRDANGRWHIRPAVEHGTGASKLKFHRFVITKTCSSYESEIIFAGFALHIANSHKINSRRRYPLTNKIYDFSMGYVMQ